MAEERVEWKERLASIENQRENAEKRAQAAETAKTKAEVQAEGLAARVEALEAGKGSQQRQRRREEQPTLPFDGENPV